MSVLLILGGFCLAAWLSERFLRFDLAGLTGMVGAVAFLASSLVLLVLQIVAWTTGWDALGLTESISLNEATESCNPRYPHC